MRNGAALILLAALAAPASAARPAVTHELTVDQLEQVLAHVRNRWDGRLAKQISNMKLTQRLSPLRLARLEGQLPGAQSREALVALADESAFLDLPPGEIPSNPTPSLAVQSALLAQTSDYLSATLDRLPGFTATRTTTRFEGTSTVISGRLQTELFTLNLWRAPSAVNWECPGQTKIGYRRLSIIDQTRVAVVDRHGHELHALGEKDGEFECPEDSVSTTEEFGPVLAWIAQLIAGGEVSWSHWEQGPTGLVAVFQYAALETWELPVQERVQGEIAIDPAGGAILRFTQVRRWSEHEPAQGSRPAYDAPIEREAEIEYGSVNLGGAVFWCPVRRVAIYRTPILWPRGSDPGVDGLYRENGLTQAPLQEYLNDVTFSNYRLLSTP